MALVVVGAPIHLSLLDSALDELGRRGWRCVALQVPGACDLSAEALRHCGDVLELEALIPDVPRRSLRSSGRKRLVVEEWARRNDYDDSSISMLSGLDVYSRMVDQVSAAYELLMRNLKPHVVLTVNETSLFVEPAAEVGSKYAVPTVNVQHGNIAKIARMSDFQFTTFCVFGDAAAETLSLLGTADAKIRVTGNPFMDDLSSPLRIDTESDGAATRQNNESRDSTFTVLFIAGYSGDFVSDTVLFSTISTVLECAERDVSIRVVVKLHPVGEGAEIAYTTALKQHPGADVTVVRHSDIYDLIAQSDCVAANGSTVAIEAALLRKPVVILTPVGMDDWLPLVSEGVALRASDSEEFAECVRLLRGGWKVSTQTYDAFDCRYAFTGKRSAGERIADICQQLSSQQEDE